MAAGFIIGGDTYEIPSLYSFDMDENKIMFDLSGKPTEDWLLMLEAAKADTTSDERLEEINRDIKNPGFLRAMVHVAYRREHRDTDVADVDVVVGRSNQVGNWAALFLPDGEPAEAEPEDPTQAGSTAKDEGSSTQETPAKPTNEGSSRTHGNGSDSGSDRPAETPAHIGTGGSDTSSPQSPAWMSVR